MQDMIGDKKLSEGKQGNTPPKLDLTPEQVAAMRRAERRPHAFHEKRRAHHADAVPVWRDGPFGCDVAR